MLNMNTEQYALFRSFSDTEQARQFALTLKELGIDSELVDNSYSSEEVFTGTQILSNSVQLKIKQSDFEKANKFMLKEAESLITEIESDHYLHSFTDEELYEILMKPDEWSPLDYQIAHKLLQNRGKTIDAELLSVLRKQRIEDLAKPAETQKAWITLAYISTIFGGFIGIIIGWHVFTYKKVLPDGSKVYAYNHNERKHGKTILIIGAIIFPIAFLVSLFLSYFAHLY